MELSHSTTLLTVLLPHHPTVTTGLLNDATVLACGPRRARTPQTNLNVTERNLFEKLWNNWIFSLLTVYLFDSCPFVETNNRVQVF